MRYYSRGKILLSGEYVVLFGARALALPSTLGQHLEVKETPGTGKIRIKSYLNTDLWFSCLLENPGLRLLETSNDIVSSFVVNLLQAAAAMKQNAFPADRDLELRSELEFDTQWGLGSSSSLISNLAQWLEVDPFELFWKVSPGSGYDIACARSAQPLLYRLADSRPETEPVKFEPPFRENLYFIYLGNKQDSQYTVREFRSRFQSDAAVNDRISRISEAILEAGDLKDFEALLDEHETVMSGYLDMPTLKAVRFSRFPGTIKSLGAWGGDMVLVTWRDSEEELRRYFNTRGLKLIFRYDALVGSK